MNHSLPKTHKNSHKKCIYSSVKIYIFFLQKHFLFCHIIVVNAQNYVYSSFIKQGERTLLTSCSSAYYRQYQWRKSVTPRRRQGHTAVSRAMKLLHFFTETEAVNPPRLVSARRCNGCCLHEAITSGICLRGADGGEGKQLAAPPRPAILHPHVGPVLHSSQIGNFHYNEYLSGYLLQDETKINMYVEHSTTTSIY